MDDDAPRIAIDRIGEFDGQSVRLEGWLHNLRRSGKLLFPVFRDGTGFLQAVVVKVSVPAEVFDRCRHLTHE